MAHQEVRAIDLSESHSRETFTADYNDYTAMRTKLTFLTDTTISVSGTWELPRITWEDVLRMYWRLTPGFPDDNSCIVRGEN